MPYVGIAGQVDHFGRWATPAALGLGLIFAQNYLSVFLFLNFVFQNC
jgi:hypothetical protein